MALFLILKPRLSVKESKSTEGRITITEASASQTLKDTKSNKSLRTSGFNADVFKVIFFL